MGTSRLGSGQSIALPKRVRFRRSSLEALGSFAAPSLTAGSLRASTRRSRRQSDRGPSLQPNHIWSGTQGGSPLISQQLLTQHQSQYYAWQATRSSCWRPPSSTHRLTSTTLSNHAVGISHALNCAHQSGFKRRPSRSHSMFPSANGMRARIGSGLLRLKMTGIFP